jgi:hypothetical protein
MQTAHAMPGVGFYEDGRAVWRITWTLACGFLLVSGLMRADGAAPWPLFAGIAVLLLWIGVSALRRSAKPLLDVLPEGLRFHAGEVGRGGHAEASSTVVPWETIVRVDFERRQAARDRDGDPMVVTALRFVLSETATRPDGHRGFLEELSGRRGEWALGEHLIWNPATRELDLLTSPRGGYARLTAAIANAAPRLGDPSTRRHPRWEGRLVRGIYDLALAVATSSTALLVVTDTLYFYVRLAEGLLHWGGGLRLP